MTKKKIASFQEELAAFMKKKAKTNAKVSSLIDSVEKGAVDFFPEMIEGYHAHEKEKAHLEQNLLKTFHWNDFQKLDLPPSTFPKMLRGLPRFYNRENPAKSEIKRSFTNLDSLRKQYLDKALFHLYRDIEVIDLLHVSLFTWVMNDGLGDLYASLAIAEILKEAIPSLKLDIFVLLPKDHKISFPGAKVHKILYKKEKDLKVSLFSKKHIEVLASSSLILQAPTCFPDTEALLQKVAEKADLMPKYELLGEYGFVDSKHFHPESGYRSLGLNFLEKGILLKKVARTTRSDLLKLSFKERLFGKKDLETYKRSLHLGYFYSMEGIRIFLEILFSKKKGDIDLVVPNPEPLMRFLEKMDPEKVFKKADIKNILVFYQKKKFSFPMQKKGRELRFFVEENLTQEDFGILLQESDGLVSVRGDRSFSEAVSANQCYFYDAPYHAKNFLKDLQSLAEYYLKDYPQTIQFIRIFSQNIKRKRTKAEYVEEEFFQENVKTEALAKEAAFLASDPSCALGLKKLNRILYRYYSGNDFVVSLVKRALLHHNIAEIEQYEKKLFEDFLRDEISFPELIDNLRIVLNPHKNTIKTGSGSFIKRIADSL